MLNCTNCSWKNSETCRVCRLEQEQEQEAKEQKQVAETPIPDNIERIRKLVEDIKGRKTWAFNNADDLLKALHGLDKEVNEEYCIDEVELVDPKYYHQN